MSASDPLREHVVDLLRRTVERRFDQAIADFPIAGINERPPHLDYSFWALIEHLRIGQWDIVEYVLNPKHVSPPHPEGYWPGPDVKAAAQRDDRQGGPLRVPSLKGFPGRAEQGLRFSVGAGFEA